MKEIWRIDSKRSLGMSHADELGPIVVSDDKVAIFYDRGDVSLVWEQRFTTLISRNRNFQGRLLTAMKDQWWLVDPFERESRPLGACSDDISCIFALESGLIFVDDEGEGRFYHLKRREFCKMVLDDAVFFPKLGRGDYILGEVVRDGKRRMVLATLDPEIGWLNPAVEEVNLPDVTGHRRFVACGDAGFCSYGSKDDKSLSFSSWDCQKVTGINMSSLDERLRPARIELAIANEQSPLLGGVFYYGSGKDMVSEIALFCTDHGIIGSQSVQSRAILGGAFVGASVVWDAKSDRQYFRNSFDESEPTGRMLDLASGKIRSIDLGAGVYQTTAMDGGVLVIGFDDEEGGYMKKLVF